MHAGCSSGPRRPVPCSTSQKPEARLAESGIARSHGQSRPTTHPGHHSSSREPDVKISARLLSQRKPHVHFGSAAHSGSAAPPACACPAQLVVHAPALPKPCAVSGSTSGEREKRAALARARLCEINCSGVEVQRSDLLRHHRDPRPRVEHVAFDRHIDAWVRGAAKSEGSEHLVGVNTAEQICSMALRCQGPIWAYGARTAEDIAAARYCMHARHAPRLYAKRQPLERPGAASVNIATEMHRCLVDSFARCEESSQVQACSCVLAIAFCSPSRRR